MRAVSPPDTKTRRDWLAAALLVGTVLTLGFNWPLLALGLRQVSPLWLSSLRLLGATAVIFLIASASGRLKAPPRSDRAVIASVAFGRLIVVMVLVFMALRLVPAGRSSVLVWTSSLWTVPLAATFLGERMTRRRWQGLAAGIAGMLILVEPWQSDLRPSVLLGYGLLLVAAVAQAATAVHVRAHSWTATPLELLPWQLLTAVIPLTTVTFALEGFPPIDWTLGLAAIVAYQGVLATGYATWAQLTVLRRLPAVTTNLTLMMVPVIGLLSSALVLGELLTFSTLLGAGLIALGVLTGVGIEPVETPPLR
jgi:drug/metabolite transporter (DMT)-like permease